MFENFIPLNLDDPEVIENLLDNPLNAICKQCGRWTSIRFHLKNDLCPDCREVNKIRNNEYV